MFSMFHTYLYMLKCHPQSSHKPKPLAVHLSTNSQRPDDGRSMHPLSQPPNSVYVTQHYLQEVLCTSFTCLQLRQRVCVCVVCFDVISVSFDHNLKHQTNIKFHHSHWFYRSYVDEKNCKMNSTLENTRIM